MVRRSRWDAAYSIIRLETSVAEGVLEAILERRGGRKRRNGYWLEQGVLPVSSRVAVQFFDRQTVGRMSAVTAIVVYISLFFVAFLVVTVCLMLFRKDTMPLPPYINIKNLSVNSASRTTAARKERTLDNPVGMLNGQQVFLKVSTNPPR
jgi:hypothetical protein